MTTANIITILRIILVPIFIVILLTEMDNKELLALSVFVIAAISDSIDGYIARKFNQITDLGKFLDPLADKLLVASALMALVYLKRAEAWVASVIILREIIISGFRFYFLVQDSVFSASWLAKKKTFFQMAAIAMLIIYNELPDPQLYYKLGTGLLYVAAFLTVYSGVEYILKYSISDAKK